VTDEDRERIARQYGVTVPEGVTIQKIPRGVSAMPANYTRKEAVQRQSKVMARRWRFQAAERKRKKMENLEND
jgi:hypothetical protein